MYMEYTERYVYLNQVNANVRADGLAVTFNLGISQDRPTTILLEVISATATTTATVDAIVVKTENPAINYSSPDLKGSSIAVLNMTYDLAVGVQYYSLLGQSPKLSYSGTMNHITLILEDSAGVPLPLSDVSPFSMVVKISYPKVDVIQAIYRNQIPL